MANTRCAAANSRRSSASLLSFGVGSVKVRGENTIRVSAVLICLKSVPIQSNSDLVGTMTASIPGDALGVDLRGLGPMAAALAMCAHESSRSSAKN